MISKKYRVKSFNEYKELLASGEYFGVKEIYIKYIKNDLPYSKMSVVVPIKIDKRAVVRNRIRRQLSEILRLMHKDIKKGFNIVLFCKNPVLEMEREDMKKQVEYILEKANLKI